MFSRPDFNLRARGRIAHHLNSPIRVHSLVPQVMIVSTQQLYEHACLEVTLGRANQLADLGKSLAA